MATKRIEPWKAWAFVGGFVLVALFVRVQFAVRHGTASTQPEQRSYRERSSKSVESEPNPERIVRESERYLPSQRLTGDRAVETYTPPPPRPKTPEEIAAEKAAFRARYLVPQIQKSTNRTAVALLAVTEDEAQAFAVADVLREKFKDSSASLIPNLFKPAFISDGYFARALSDPNPVIEELEIAKSVDALLFGRQSVQYTAHPNLENVLTAQMQLEVSLLPTDWSRPARKWTFSASGAGFNRTDARNMAEERALKQLSADNKMTLETIPKP